MYEPRSAKSVLIPFWSIRLVATTVLLVLTALAASYAAQLDEDYDDDYDVQYAAQALSIAAIILLSWCSATIVFDITETILFCCDRFTPVTNVVLSSIETTLWLFMFITTVIGAAEEGTISVVSLICLLAILLTAIGQLVYASVLLHRYRKSGAQQRGTYALAGSESAQVRENYIASGSEAAPVRENYIAYSPPAAITPFADSPVPLPTPAHNHVSVAEYYGNTAYNGASAALPLVSNRYA